jgi:endonuclease/exonuclease/phosphatase family metal-dependent hydrolase
MKIRHSLPIALLLLIAGVAASAQQQQVTVRVCTYNVLDFGQPTAARSSALGFILQRLNADILVFHAIEGVNGFTEVQNVIPKLHHYQAAEFFDGVDSDNAMFYDTTKLRVIAHTTIPTDLRAIDKWTTVVRLTGDTIEVYGCHLKEGESTADQNQREQEVIAYREAAGFAPPTRHRIMAGDLNVYADSEPAYQRLAGITDSPIHFGDPINREGSWHNNATFADIHTQSTRIDQLDGGTGGGLVDRFDFVLTSPSLSPHLVPG